MGRKLLIILVLFTGLSGYLLFRHVSNVNAATTITVNSTADTSVDDGVCTLREAITAANTDTASGVTVGECAAGSGAGDTIEFDIAGAGPHTISPTSLLPNIATSMIIDGYTETGAVANTNPAPQGLNGTLMIEVDLSSAAVGGTITITGPDVTIRGLVVNGATSHAFSLHTSSNNAVFEGNYIGTSVSGLAADANGGNGITSQVPNTTVGGTDPADRNLISGNGFRAVQIGTDAGDNGVIQGNLIGTDVTGNAALGNGTGGIMITGADNITVGGTASGAQNVISGNTSTGIALIESSVTNTVQGNYIGLGNDGSTDVGNAGPGLLLGGSGNTVGGSTSNARNIVSGNGGSGIELGAADSNTIQGNYVGLNVAGTALVANDGRGIYLYQSDVNIIGGDASGEGNVVAGNSEGISIEESDTNTVSGNYVGLNAAGDADLGNGAWGMRIFSDSDSNIIGGDTSAERNLISGNGDDGILVTDSTTSSNQIIGNYIGTDITGAVDIGNSSDGISVLNGATSTTIGSGTSGHGNVISGNGDNGVVVSSSGTIGTVIQGNTIGLNAAGTADRGNDDNGIAVNTSAPAVTIGGSTSGEGNVISGNAIDGVQISSTAASSSTIRGNIIGLNAAGDADLGNTDDGIELASASNFIGGATSTARNVISGNDNDGILITGASASSNSVQGNYIGLNAAGTADLGNIDDGVEVSSAASTLIGGDTSAERNVISGNNEHGVVVGGATATSTVVRANYIGVAADGTADLGNTADGIVTHSSAPAITIGGATSGMGNVISGNGLHGIVLNSTSSSSTIQGNTVGLDSGGTLDRGNDGDGLNISSESTAIGGSTAGMGNVISGNGQDGIYLASTATSSTIQGNTIGLNAAGTADRGNTSEGIYTDASSVVVGGVDSNQRNVISGNDSDGINAASSTTGLTVLGNYIGTSADGMSDLGNTTDGVEGYNMMVGGTTSGSRNIISGNNARGITAAGGSTIQGNYIGLNVAGSGAVPNGDGSNSAVNITGNNNLLGGTTSAARNVISGNTSAVGVIIVGVTAFGGGSSSDNVVQGNYIGTNTSGEVQSGFGNNLGIVILLDALNNMVGGTAAGTSNVIAGNGGGIASFGISGAGLLPLNNSFLGNSIYSNAGGSFQGQAINLGIDLFDNPTGDFTNFVNIGVNANDADDPDTPANRYMNYPVISSVASDNGQATVTYSLDINDAEVGATGYRVEFFANDSPDSSGNGQGQTYLGATTVAGDVTDAVANLTLPAGVSGPKYISAVTTMTDNSTDGFGHSSEFSANLMAVLEAAAGGGGSGSGSSGSVNLADTGTKVLLITAIAVASVTLGLYILQRRKAYTSGK